MTRSSLLLAATLFFVAIDARAEAPQNRWTILFYGAGAYEKQLVKTIGRIRDSVVDGQGVELIALVDRPGEYKDEAEILGDDWLGTRLYRVRHGKIDRLPGGEHLPAAKLDGDGALPTGEPATLRDFLRFGKAAAPAERYALIFFGHGNGHDFCRDGRTGKALQPTEISASLERSDSVDLVVFDVCFMAGAEIAYQWRPGGEGFHAQAMVASPGLSDALPYERILPLLDKTAAGGVDPATLDPFALGELIVATTEEHRRDAIEREPMYACEVWGCYDLSKVGALKRAVDELAVELDRTDGGLSLLEKIRGSGAKPATMNYLDREGLESGAAWIAVPYFDLYDLARRVAESEEASEALRRRAKTVQQATDDVVFRSFGERDYPGFVAGRNGIYLTFPDGDASYWFRRHWDLCRWYTPIEPSGEEGPYGRWAWCAEGAASGNDRVENWFELLDRWYDRSNDETGGSNGYRW